MDNSYEVPRSGIPQDRGGFFFFLRPPRGVDGWFLPIPVVIVVVGGGYFLLRADMLAGSLRRRLCLGRGRHLLGVSSLFFFPGKFAHLNLMGCIIWPLTHLGLYLYFLASPQSNFKFQYLWCHHVID
jgi:hypothetical protein